jgi:broad specificity phosphatase PhoE
MKQRIFLIRHGETEWSLSGQHTGLTDIPLTENGKNQALQIKTLLHNHTFQAVFCSPLQRAKKTCEIAGFTPVHIEPLLSEWNYGDYEGLTTPFIHQTNPHWNIFKNGAPNGETPEDVKARTEKVLSLIKTIPGDVALVAHGHFLRALVTTWLKLPIEMGKLFHLSPATISILGFERQQHVITLWNASPSQLIPTLAK